MEQVGRGRDPEVVRDVKPRADDRGVGDPGPRDSAAVPGQEPQGDLRRSRRCPGSEGEDRDGRSAVGQGMGEAPGPLLEPAAAAIEPLEEEGDLHGFRASARAARTASMIDSGAIARMYSHVGSLRYA